MHVKVFLSAFYLLSLPVASGIQFDGRIGISSDGNFHDKDDIGASAFSIAIAMSAGARVVHHDYNCHIWDSDEKRETIMSESVLGTAERYGVDEKVFFDDRKDKKGAIENIAKEIDRSSKKDRFYYVCGGPMHVPWEGIMASDPKKRKFCTVISHSGWNNNHNHKSKTWADIKKTGVKTILIEDQNRRLNTFIQKRKKLKNPEKGWEWLRDSGDSRLQWLYKRMAWKMGDISDSGMVYYVVSGLKDEQCTIEKLRRLLLDFGHNAK